ncbi:MAG TPA: hypothetical protein VI727_03315, partial [Candidatus Brocadiaceae bacterium]|nr:hypothetical protein [Candidatus Brocadiaceae bacterium]
DTKNNYEIPRAEKNGSGTVVFVNSRKSGSVLGGVFTTEKCNYFCERRYFVIDKSLLMSDPHSLYLISLLLRQLACIFLNLCHLWFQSLL